MAAKKRHQNQNANANSESSNATRKKYSPKRAENKGGHGNVGDALYKFFIATVGKWLRCSCLS